MVAVTTIRASRCGGVGMLDQVGKHNLLLSMLSASDYSAIAAHSAVVDLVAGRDLAAAGDLITHCWFPLSGLASVIAEDGDGRDAEVGIVGYDGIVNGSATLGRDHSAMRILVQVAGTAVRVEARFVLSLADKSEAFFRLIMAYEHALAVQAAFSGLAYARYPIHQRLARWMLMCGDRVGDDHIDLTHDALSIMLGVRRAGVTIALQDLVTKGAIVSRRGGQSIADRPLLERLAGAGYGAAEAEYRRMVKSGFPAAHSSLVSHQP